MPHLAGETYAQGVRRLAGDLNAALRALRDSASNPDAGWKLASLVIEQGSLREVRALDSIRVFAASNGGATQAIDAMIARVKSKQGELMADLQAYAGQLYGRAPAPAQLSPDEIAATRKVPANATPLQTYFTNRDSVRAGGELHGLMRAEVFNFVDGKRSYWDIYKVVCAEALAGASWYYGTVSLKDVVALLNAAVEAKALVLK